MATVTGYPGSLETMADQKKEIIKIIQSISGKYSEYEVFSDWIRCCALATSNACCMWRDEVWKNREQAYMDTIRKYTANEADLFSEMLILLGETLEADLSDALGSIFMEAGMGSKSTGQFFTPYHISFAMAQMTAPEPDEDGVLRINEPSCGGGGTIIAVADVLKRRGINYQRCMRVVAQDLDWKSVYMCYLQLSLLVIRAVCVQGDTLMEPYKRGRYPKARVLYTPAEMGVLL